MKTLFKALPLLFLILVSGQANAQDFKLLKIDSFGLLRDTLRFGDSVNFVYRVTNISDSNALFEDTITTYLKTSLDTTPLQLSRAVFAIPKDGNVIINTRFKLTSPHFINNRVTEITFWPEANGQAAFSPTFDSVKQLVMVVTVLNVPENIYKLNNIKLYPNPVKNILHLETTNPANAVKIMTIRDLQGRIILRQPGIFGRNNLNIEAIKKGLYILEVQYADNSTENYRIIKTD